MRSCFTHWGAGLLISLAPVAGAGTLYVDDDASPGGNGGSWETAFAFLQDALAAAGSGDEVRVAQGTYFPDRDAEHPTGTGDRAASFTLKDGVALMGGYAGLGAPEPDARDIALYETILSGDISTPVDNSDNSYHVVSGGGASPTALLDGFTVTAGHAEGTATSDGGGGVYCVSSNPTLANCTIMNNTGTGTYISGAGVYCVSSSPTLTNCTITGNSAVAAHNWGGGMACVESSATLTNSVIVGNSAGGEYGDGGGLSCSGPGLTLTNCTIADNLATNSGGGVDCSGSSPTFIGCTITGNTANYDGGGVKCGADSNPTLLDCTIAGNTAIHGNGGGVDCGDRLTLSDCTITGNAASDGRGGGAYCGYYSVAALANCTIAGNTATSGGGVCCDYYAEATLADCTIARNVATSGAGVFCDHYTSPTLVGCSITGNAAGTGGGVYCYWHCNAALVNCTITGNATSGSGGGICCAWWSNPVLTNCTITANASATHGGAVRCANSDPTLSSCILWANAPEAISVLSSSPVVTYCDVQGGYEGAGNIDADPLFVRDPDAGADGQWGTPDDDFGDLHLTHGSPCIDAGDNAAVPAGVTTDLDGNRRIWDGYGGGTAIVDMGAYEFDSHRYGDMNCDGAVGVGDINPFVMALSNWGAYVQQFPGCDIYLADINGDRYVDFGDINPFVTLLSTHSLLLACSER